MAHAWGVCGLERLLPSCAATMRVPSGRLNVLGITAEKVIRWYARSHAGRASGWGDQGTRAEHGMGVRGRCPRCCCRVPTLTTWGVVAGVGTLFFLEPVPLVRRDILSKLPVIGKRYVVEE